MFKMVSYHQTHRMHSTLFLQEVPGIGSDCQVPIKREASLHRDIGTTVFHKFLLVQNLFFGL